MPVLVEEEGEILEHVDDEGISSMPCPCAYFGSEGSHFTTQLAGSRPSKRGPDDVDCHEQPASDLKRFRLFEDEEKSAKMFQHVICSPDAAEQVQSDTFVGSRVGTSRRMQVVPYESVGLPPPAKWEEKRPLLLQALRDAGALPEEAAQLSTQDLARRVLQCDSAGEAADAAKSVLPAKAFPYVLDPFQNRAIQCVDR
jgi:hypothetical protein